MLMLLIYCYYYYSFYTTDVDLYRHATNTIYR